VQLEDARHRLVVAANRDEAGQHIGRCAPLFAGIARSPAQQVATHAALDRRLEARAVEAALADLAGIGRKDHVAQAVIDLDLENRGVLHQGERTFAEAGEVFRGLQRPGIAPDRIGQQRSQRPV